MLVDVSDPPSRRAWESLFSQVPRLAAASADLFSMLDGVALAATRTGCDIVVFWLGSDGALSLAALADGDHERAAFIRRAMQNPGPVRRSGLIGRVLATGTPHLEVAHTDAVIVRPGTETSPDDLAVMVGATSCAVAPLQMADRSLGAVCLVRTGPRPALTWADADNLLGLASLVSPFIEAHALRQDLQRAEQVVSTMCDAAVTTDRAGLVVSWNRAAEHMYGIRSCEAIGRAFSDLVRVEHVGASAEVRKKLQTGLQEAFLRRLSRDGMWSGALRHTTPSGSVLDVEASISLLTGADGTEIEQVSVYRDVTDAVRSRLQGDGAGRLARAVLDASASSVAVIDSRGEILHVNHAWATVAESSGADPAKTGVGANYLAVLDAIEGHAEAGKSADGIRAVLDGRLGEFRLDYDMDPGDDESGVQGRFYCLHAAAVPNVTGDLSQGAVIVHDDITARKNLENRLHFQATHDELTLLPNRRELLKRSTTALLRGDRVGHVGLIFADLDGFKEINDRHGHHVGDAVLRIVAKRLKNCVRGIDTVARVGGDEFVVLIEDLRDPELLEATADRVLLTLRRPVMVGGLELVVGVSAGVAKADDRVADQEQAARHIDRLLARADAAMYVAKGNGGRTVRFAD